MDNNMLNQLTEQQRELCERYVNSALFSRVGKKMMICAVTCWNDFEIIGVAGCADPSKFDESLGRKYSLQDALNKLQEMVVFHVAEQSKEKKSPVDDMIVLNNQADKQQSYTLDALFAALEKKMKNYRGSGF